MRTLALYGANIKILHIGVVARKVVVMIDKR